MKDYSIYKLIISGEGIHLLYAGNYLLYDLQGSSQCLKKTFFSPGGYRDSFTIF